MIFGRPHSHDAVSSPRASHRRRDNGYGSVAAASISGQQGRVIDAALFAEVRDKRDRAAGPIMVPEDQYPTMVTFTDIADPASVALVDPADLAASFGPGVRLKSVVLEVTEESVTEGKVEGVLGWLREIRPSRLDGQRYETINQATGSQTRSERVGFQRRL